MLLVHSDPEQSYSEFITQIMETVHLCDGMDSRLDISIHFHECHFAPNYKFNIDAMRALGVNCPGAKVTLFIPPLLERDRCQGKFYVVS